MKKRLLGLLLILALVFAFVGCTSPKHEAAAEWKKDETNHWHACVIEGCEEVFEKAEHAYGEGTVAKAATKEAAGEMKYTCTVCGYEKTEAIAKLATVADVLSLKNNDEVKVTAVVFAKTAEGFYVSDGTAGIYAKYSTANAAKLAALKVGDEVELTGKYAESNKQPFVKNADTAAIASGKAALQAKADKFVTINALDTETRANFGVLYTTVAAVSIDTDTSAIKLTDDTGYVFVADANYSDYEKYVGKKISTSFVLSAKNGANWTVYGLAETASEYFVNIDEVKETIYAGLNLPEQVIGSLELVTTFASEPGVVFTWSVKDGTAITIENNIPTVDLTITEDATVTLTLLLVSGETQATKDFTLTVKALKKVTLAAGVAETDYVQVDALVVGAGVADETGTVHYIIVTDDNATFYLIDVTSAVRKSVAVGDKITFVAKWVSDEDLQPATPEEKIVKRPRYADVKLISKTGTEAVDYATLGATTLEVEDDYANMIANDHEAIKLYKIVSPFMVGSGTSNYNWNRFGSSAGIATNGLQADRLCSLLIRNLAENGLDTWEADYAVPTKTAGAKQYPGTVIYAFSVYQTGDTVWSFILPCKDACYYDEAEEVKMNVAKALPEEITATDAGNYKLPESLTIGEKNYALTWTVETNDFYDATTGDYTFLLEPATLEATVKFNIGEVEKEFKFALNFVCEVAVPVDCSTAIATAAAAEGGVATIKKLEAYVASLGASSENNANYNQGIMLTDGKKVIYFATSNYTIGEGEAAHKLTTGDKVIITKAKVAVDADGQMVTDGTIELVSTGNTIDYSNLVIDVTVTNEEELSTFIGAHGVTHGMVIKFAGETMYMVGTGSSSATGRYQVNYKNAASSAGSRYTYNLETDNSKSLCINLAQTLDLLGSDWWTACGLPEKSSGKSYELSGSFIAVGGYNGKTLQAFTVINKDEFKLTSVSEYILVKRAIAKAVEAEINAYAAGTATLLDKVTVGETDYALTWVSSDDNVLNGQTGAYAAVTAETKVVMTAHYTIGTEEYTFDVEYTLTATAPAPKTITEATALAKETKVTAAGAVIAFISDGNSAELNKGFLLMDNATGTIMQVRNIKTGATYPAYNYKDTTTAIAIGDSVIVKGTINEAEGTKFIDLGAEGDVTFVEKVTLNFHEGEATSAVVTISTDAELAALISSGNYIGKIIKMVGTAENPIHVSGSGTGATTVCNFKVGFHYTDSQIKYAGADSTQRNISTKSDVNAPNTDGTTTFSQALYGATRADGKIGGSTDIQRVGTLYIAICYTTSTYYQASIINFAGCSLTAAAN